LTVTVTQFLIKLYTFVGFGRFKVGINSHARKTGEIDGMHSRKYLFILFFILSFPFAQGQDLSQHNWYFGNSTHALRFNRTTNAAELISKSLPQPFGVGGSAVATDHTNRNVLFYTDGQNVYDVTGAVMPGGSLSGASSQNQPVVTCPVPGTPNQFYIFTRDAAGTVSSSTVDMTQFGNSPFPAPPTGQVVPGGAVPGLTNRSQAMLLVAHPSDTVYFLITQQTNTTNYTVTTINSAGISSNMFGGLGFNLSASSFSYHEATGRIAVAPTDADMNVLILNFNNTTGSITSPRFLFNTSAAATTQPATYDTEFSFNGQYLYLSRTGDAGIDAQVLQYDFNNPQNTVDTVATPTLFRSWGLQMAPDSSIYHLYEETAGIFKVGRLANTDSTALATTYTPDVFGALNFNSKQFPSFAPKPRLTLTVNFTEQGLCTNTTTAFFPTVTPGADSLVWSFGDGNFSSAWSPVHTYAASGPMQVRVFAHLKGDTASFTKTININQFDLTLSLVMDTTACKCELPINNPLPECGNDTSDDFSVQVEIQGGTPTNIQWYGPGGILTAQTTETLRPDSAGYYFVVVTDATGCSAHAGINIREYGLEERVANIWYFGNRAGIDFNNGVVPISNPVMDAPEGCAIVCDQNGQAIFFSDGNTVWNRDFAVLDTGIGGSLNATQSVFIMPVPDDETLYYIFTTQEIYGSGVYELRYSLFDLKADNGLGGNGDVVQKAIPLFANSTERITGNNNWMIAHEFGNNSFRAYNISAQGISQPVISSIGSDHQITIQQHGEGYMKLGTANRLGVALHTPGVSNVIEVFDFIDSTGTIANFRTADLETTSGEVYGLEFSPGGNKLFATLTGASSRLVEFSIDSLGNPYLKNTFASVPNQLGAIQIAPNGQMYVAVEGQQFLGTIAPVEDTTLVSSFTLNGLQLLAATNSRLGLPNFAQSVSAPSQQPGISVTSLCFGLPTSFSATGTDIIDEFTWFFGDGSSAAGDTATHTYAAPGNYIVNLQIVNRCGLDTTISRTITILPTPTPTLPPAILLCNGPVVVEATPITNPDLANLTFLWSTGATTRAITVSTQIFSISVTMTDVNGCSGTDNTISIDNRPQVELGPDESPCQNTPIAPLDAQNPGLTYAWTINGGSNTATQTRSVNTTVPGIFEYKVTISDPITLCTVTDSITYTVNALPVFTTTVTDASCGLADGQIDLAIPASGGSYSYAFTGPPAVQAVNQAGPINTSFTNLASGSYGLTIQDDLSGCQATSVVGVGNSSFSVTASKVGTCDPLAIQITPSVPGTYDYRVRDASNPDPITNIIIAQTSLSANPLTTAIVPSGFTYLVELITPACIATDTAVLNQINQIPINGFTTACSLSNGTQVTVDAPGATSFVWTELNANPGNIIPPGNAAAVEISTGFIELQVVVDDGAGGLCPNTGIFNATGVDAFTASLTPPDPCLDQPLLRAEPSGSFNYLWTRSPAPDPVGGQQLTLVPADDGANYTVTVRSTISGCASMASLTVTVVGEFSAVLSSTPPCEGTPFTLTTTPTQTPDAFAWTFNGSTLSGVTGATHQDTRNGEYEVTVTRDVCTDVQTITITNAPTTPGQLPSEGIICDLEAGAQEVPLNPGAGFISFQWYKDGVILNDLFSQAQVYPATESGIYRVDLLNTFNCASTDEINLVRECDPRIVAPTAFRPGGTNPVFFIYSYFIADTGFQIFIFNRWGEMVYESTNANFTWNGTSSRGELLPAGTYTYVVKYKSSFRDETGETRGGVVLVR
jgi:large repetitive protein